MNKMEVKEKIKGKVVKKEQAQKVTYIFQSDEDFDILIEASKGQEFVIYHYGKDCGGKIKILLKGEDASVCYHYNTVNIHDNQVQVEVLHQDKNTISNLYFHGYNREENKLTFQVDVVIPKKMVGVKANQENRIYNRKNGISFILPNLYVDEYDVEANHASYIGPFDNELKFYMKTRGLREDVIERLLLEGLLIKEGLTEEEKLSFIES